MAAVGKDLFPCPPKQLLVETFVGKKLNDVPTPAAVLDRAVMGRNCDQMLKACKALEVGFRPHVKTHKTTEGTLLQLGEGVDDVKLVVSTVAEAEHLSDRLHDFHKQGKSVNVLYGVPLPPSQVQRLADLRNKIGPYSISVIIDNSAQLQSAHVFKEATGAPLQVYVKIDTGYRRAGLEYTTKSFSDLIKKIYLLETSGSVVLVGFYSHAGHSYSGDSELDAIRLLIDEIELLRKAAVQATKPLYRLGWESGGSLHGHSQPRYVLSVGATPTATSVENMISESAEGLSIRSQGLFAEVKRLFQEVNQCYVLELHAGVYPILDMQQLATHASPSAIPDNPVTPKSDITTADVALTILAEVISTYEERGGRDGINTPEALIAGGTLALGHDACKSYKGWGIVSDWGMNSAGQVEGNKEGRSGWQVGRISQEHGVLTEDTMISGMSMAPLTVGQKVRIWPNHACIAGAGYGWYLVVDSSLPEDRRDEIVDVWVRYRGR